MSKPPRRPREKTPAEPVDGGAIEDAVHSAIMTALMEGRLTPGSKLPEHRLAKTFGVSRERVRKVLHRLVAERRLEAAPQRGVFVPNPSPADIRAVYLAHRVFEAGVLLHLAKTAGAETFDLLDAHLAEERAAAESGDRAASVRLSGEFHTMLADALGNPELSRFLSELLLRSSLMVSAFEPARLSPCGVDEHEAIARAMRAGDVAAAIRLSDEHFRHIEERLAVGVVERREEDFEAVFAPIPPHLAGRGK